MRRCDSSRIRGCSRRIRKDALPHALAVHGAVAHEFGSEQALDLRHGGAARLGQLVRDDVRIDHRRAQPRELVGRRALAAADAAGEANHELLCTAHSWRVYQRRIGSPQYNATMPAMAM
jgi:hypothetical protein